MRRPLPSRFHATDEARVLRQLRLKNGLTMMAAAKAVGCSDSFVSHIETGRAAVPQGERLLAFLKAYGDISGKYFRELVRDYEGSSAEVKSVLDLISNLKPPQLATIKSLAEKLLSQDA